MNRSKWKGPAIDLNNKKDKKIKTVGRDIEIVPKYVGLTVGIHTGAKHVKLIVTEKMLGHKFGSFALTRKQFFFKKKQKKK